VKSQLNKLGIVVVVLTVIAVGVPTTSFILQAYAQGDGWAAGEEEGRDRMPSMIVNITQNALLITLIFGVQCTN
jgi:hypothetical protein